jgi:hypothetical protein
MVLTRNIIGRNCMKRYLACAAIILLLSGCTSAPATKNPKVAVQNENAGDDDFLVWLFLTASLAKTESTLKKVPCPFELAGSYKTKNTLFFYNSFAFDCTGKNTGQLLMGNKNKQTYLTRSFSLNDKTYMAITPEIVGGKDDAIWTTQPAAIVIGYRQTSDGIDIFRPGQEFAQANKQKIIKDKICAERTKAQHLKGLIAFGFCDFFEVETQDLDAALLIDQETPITQMTRLAR